MVSKRQLLYFKIYKTHYTEWIRVTQEGCWEDHQGAVMSLRLESGGRTLAISTEH